MSREELNDIIKKFLEEHELNHLIEENELYPEGTYIIKNDNFILSIKIIYELLTRQNIINIKVSEFKSEDIKISISCYNRYTFDDACLYLIEAYTNFLEDPPK